MDELGAGVFPPGDYDVVVVGSGPGGLQTSYALSRRGIPHAVISADDEPGGMFRKYPLFERLLSWTKPHAPDGDPRAYEIDDQNSLVAEEPELRALVRHFMDDSSDWPTRSAMAAALRSFAEKAVRVRYGCRWESTRREDDRLVLVTSDGEYRCRAAIFAVGATEPWRPSLPGIEHATHYVDLVREPARFRGRRVCIIGKRNSGFEVGNALRGVVRELSLVSPSPVRLDLSRAPVRTQYLAPYDQDARGAGAARVYDAALERIERGSAGFTVYAVGTARSEPLEIEADDVVAATGFGAALGDLPEFGVTTTLDGRLPVLTPFWESISAPGIFFAGNVMQAARGLRKQGVSSNSGMVVGFRYNALILARHLEERLRGTTSEQAIPSSEVITLLLRELDASPELRMQKGYLARAIRLGDGAYDAGVVPLEHFVDEEGPDAIAATIELDADGVMHPVLYVWSGGRMREEALEPNIRRIYATPAYRETLEALLRPLLRG